jgi:CubicO group peptidase (beta-lactamase class C family)
MRVLSRILSVLVLCVWSALPALAQSEPVPEAPAPAPASDATAAPNVEAPIDAVPLPPDSVVPAPSSTLADPSIAEHGVQDVPTPTPAVGDDSMAPLLQGAAPAMPQSAQLQTYVDGLVASLQREHGLSALTISVVKDDSLWIARGYGFADVASARPAVADSTLFRIGSVSKTFIWTAVMMLVERGLIDLDADVNSYLKSVRIAEAFGVPVTMRQLMHHRAGFEDSLRLFAVADDDPRTLAELLSEQQPARVYAPGLRTSYSNWGSALAAQIVSDVSGEPYGDFLRREILDPLGMQGTTFVAPSKLDETQRADLAGGYKSGKGALAAQGYMQIGPYWPAGGIASTATEMARWMRFHLNGGELDGVRLLRAQTHAQMWTRAHDDRPGAPDVAHGFQDRSYRGLRVLGHGGATAAFYTNMVLVPELGLGVFISQNSVQSRLPVTQLPDQIIDRVHGGTYQAGLDIEAGDSDYLADVAGTYLQNRRVFSSFAAVLGLNSTGQVTPLSADALLVTLNGAAKQYLRVDKQRDLFEAADGNRIAFVREGGRVVALADSSGVHTLEKVHLLSAPATALGAVGVAVLLALTSLLGFWWRLGRGAAYGAGYAAGFAAFVSLISALCVLGFAVVTGLLVIELSKLDLSTMAANYPSQMMLYTSYAGWAVAGAAGAMLIGLIPAWVATGWGLWRRLHYSVFALVLALAAFLLWQWRVFAAPVY